MGMEYWPIMGYGVCLVYDAVDWDRAAVAYPEYLEEAVDEREDMVALACAITARDPRLAWCSTAEMYCDAEHFYIYLPFLAPWQAPVLASREEADAVLLAAVGPVLREGTVLKPEFVADVGCG